MDIISINYGDANWQYHGGLFIKSLGARMYGVVKVENYDWVCDEPPNDYLWVIERGTFYGEDLDEYKAQATEELGLKSFELEEISDEWLVVWYIGYYGRQISDGHYFKPSERDDMERTVQDMVDNY